MLKRADILTRVAALIPALYELVAEVAEAVRADGEQGKQVSKQEGVEIALAAQRFLEKVVAVVKGA